MLHPRWGMKKHPTGNIDSKTLILWGGDSAVPGAGSLKTMPVATMSASSRVSPSRVYPGYPDMRYLHVKEAAHYSPHATNPYLDGYHIRSSAGEIKRRLTLLPTVHQIHPDLLGPPIANQADRGSHHPPVTYYSSYGNEASSAGGEGGPPKKPRLCMEPKPELRQPLHVDTDSANNPSYKKDCAYLPQVEAISPTLPGEGGSAKEESPLKATKDELLSKISKVDRDIALAESNISKLKKKQQELEEAAKKPEGEKQVAEEPKEVKHQSIAHKIYAENKKKADESHKSLRKMGPEMDLNLPLYNQPSDTDLYHENRRKYQTFKKSLLEFFKKDTEEKARKEKYLVDTYSRGMENWMRRVDRIEGSKKKKERDAKARELYEKVFPELRKQREDKERFSRVGTRIKSDAELEEIMDGLQEQEMEEKKMRNLAVIAPILVDQQSRQLRFRNGNSFIEDPKALYLDRHNQNIWTDAEKEIFKEKFLQHPKNFGAIAQYLERKNVMECVQYYYLSKKKECYKQLLRKSRQRTRAKAMQKPQAPPQFIIQEIVGANTTGVTTRGSVAALQREKQQPEDVPVTDEQTECPSIKTEMEEPEGGGGEQVVPMDSQPPETHEVKQECPEPMEEEPEQPPSPTQQEPSKTASHQCCVCNTELQFLSESRPIIRSQASHYGLEEEALPAEPRVCSSCHCQFVRRRYIKCPILTCPTPKARGTTRLRSFPSKWREMDAEQKEAIIKELEIPPDTKRCCGACFSRIARKIGSPTDPGFSSDGEDGVRWTDAEIGALRQALSKYGRQWDKVSEAVRTKTNMQCEVFYGNNRKTHRLYLLVREYRKSTEGKEGEGSEGESTDSSEEYPPGGSDTASASSPARASFSEPSAPTSVHNKEDYDSSATVSADEGQGESEETPAKEYLRVSTQPKNNNSIPISAIKPENLPTPEPSTAAVKIKDVIEQTISRSLPVDGGNIYRANAMNPPTIESILGKDQVERIRADKNRAAEPLRSTPDPRIGNFSVPTISVSQTPVQMNPEDLSVRKTPRRSPPPSISHASPSHYREPSMVGEPFEPKKAQPPPPAHSNPQNYRSFDPSRDYYQSSSTYKSQSPSSSYPSQARISSPVVARAQVSAPAKNTVKANIQQPAHPPPPLITTSKHPTTVPSPKMKTAGGSITHGTPVHMATSSARYDAVLGGVLGGAAAAGSITQGTPVATGSTVSRPGIVYDRGTMDSYYKRPPHSASQLPPPPQSTFSYPRPPYPAVSSETQLSAQRQIILDDYMTSKKMPNKGMGDKEQTRLSPQADPRPESNRGYYYPTSSGYASTSAPVYLTRHPTTTSPITTTANTWHQSSTPPGPHQRQVIVQRTTPFPRAKMDRYNVAQPISKPQSPRQYMAPGHEAFNVLVDTAAAQSSLSIGKDGEKRDPRYPAEYTRIAVPKPALVEGKPQAMIAKSEGATLSAATLIDAIITHQINQGVEQPKNPNPLFSGLSKGQPTSVVATQPDPGKHSPYKMGGTRSPAAPHQRPEPKEVVTIEDGPDSARNASIQHRVAESQNAAQQVVGKAKTLGEHIDSVIELKYGMVRQVPPGSSPHFSPAGETSQPDPNYHLQHNWKRRKAMQQEENRQDGLGDERQIIRVAQSSRKPPRHCMEPVSPPIVSEPPHSVAAWVNGADAMTRVLQTTPRQAPASISPFDYVKNKIVEVMRTSSESAGQCSDEGGPMQYKRDDRNRSPAAEKRPRTESEPEKEHGSSGESASKGDNVESPQSMDETSEGNKAECRQYPPHRSTPVVVSSHYSLPPHYTPPIYQFPYSALSVRPMGAPIAVPSTTSSGPAPQRTPPTGDSKTVYTSQYEPLSDED